jgi:CBS domain-containing protein
MFKHKIKRVFVKDPDTFELVGIITTHDLVAAFNSLELHSSSPMVSSSDT